MHFNKENYKPGTEIIWTGRIDSETDFDSFRWHQFVKPLDLNNLPNCAKSEAYCLLGFACDHGVERNLGRTGAAQAPQLIREQLANLPVYFSKETCLFDAGDILSPTTVEDAQEKLAQAVFSLLSSGYFPVVLGGGHETAYGHYAGLRKFFGNEIPAIVNLDAHFDIRPYPNGGTSGTMFNQIADDCKAADLPFNYFVAGIQQSANTKALFKRAKELNIKYILARDMINGLDKTDDVLDAFLDLNSKLYLTICSDVFAASFASGVSAPQPFGLHPELGLAFIKKIVRTGKLVSFDIAEVSPRFDNDALTAKLAAIIIFAVLNTLHNPNSNLVID